MAGKKKQRRDYGSGSIYESPVGSGKWFAALRVEGHLIRRRAASEQAARARLAEIQKYKGERIDVAKGAQSYTQWLNTCHEEKKRLKKPSPRTIEHDRSLLERYIIPKLGALRLLDIRPTHIQGFVDTVYAEIQGEGKYDGARTVNAAARLIDETVTLAHKRRLILDNPYSGIVLPKYKRGKITPMEDTQCRAFLLAARGELDVRPGYIDSRGRKKRLPKINKRLFPLWASYLLLGERRGEGLGFLTENFDRKARTIKITQQVQRVTDAENTVSLLVRGPKTEQSERMLPLPYRLYDWLCEHIEGVEEEYALRGLTWTGQGLLFTSETGTPLWPDNIEAMFRRIRAAAGLPKTIKLHHLRHTLATLLDECGSTEALKADILGHAKQTQSQKYTHGRLAAMRDVLQRVEDRLLGSVVLGEETGT